MSVEHSPVLPVAYSTRALHDLDGIWEWNAETYGPEHASKYVDLLRKNIDALGAIYPKGRPVPSRPPLRYIRIDKRDRGHGHLAVYRVSDDEVVVFYVFHTAQDWVTKLAQGGSAE